MATTFSITSGDIEVLLEKSVMRAMVYPFEMNRVLAMIKSSESPNLYVDGLNFLIGKQGVKGLRKKLLDKYKNRIPAATEIPDEIKVLQGALMDSLVYCYNNETGGIDLYTLNEKIIGYLGVDNEKLISKAYDLNKEGVLHCYRIDIEYLSATDIVYKATQLNKNTQIDASKFSLFPYDVIKAIIDTTSMMLINNGVLKIDQNVSGVMKSRVATNRDDLLKKYCDNPNAVGSVATSLYPLKGYMYVPILGAPSTTAMMSKVDVFNLDSIHIITNSSQIKVKKAEDPIGILKKTRVISKRLSEMQMGDPVGYSEVISRLPRVSELFVDEASSTMPSQVAVAKYLNTLSTSELDSIISNLEGAKEKLEVLDGIFTTNESINVASVTSDDALRDMLKSGVYNVIATKKDCSYTSMIVTNNEGILKKLYGDDYFGKYESFGFRFNRLAYLVKSGKDVKESLTYCGFGTDKETVKDAKTLKDDAKAESVRDKWLEKQGTKKRAKANTDSILARSCFGSVDEDGNISEFYKYVTLKRVARLVKLG